MSQRAYAERSSRVTDADTASRFGDDFPPAASTPFVLGLAEVACHEAVAGELEPGEITVGTRAEIEHLAPSPVGATLIVKATLIERSERGRLRFHVDVHQGEAVVARVEHDRAVVPLAGILKRLEG